MPGLGIVLLISLAKTEPHQGQAQLALTLFLPCLGDFIVSLPHQNIGVGLRKKHRGAFLLLFFSM